VLEFQYGPFPRRLSEVVAVKLSARNQLSGTVTGTSLGTVMAEVTVQVNAGTIVAAITRGSAEALALSAGDNVTVIIKATEVIIGK
jgi:molybdopterin-binding protein